MGDNSRLFIGIFPCGIVYADREVEENHDYKRLAFLPYHTLQLQEEPLVPLHLLDRIRNDAASIVERKGQPFMISASQSIILGE